MLGATVKLHGLQLSIRMSDPKVILPGDCENLTLRRVAWKKLMTFCLRNLDNRCKTWLFCLRHYVV